VDLDEHAEFDLESYPAADAVPPLFRSASLNRSKSLSAALCRNRSLSARVLQAAGYQKMLAPNHPQLRNRVLQAVGISLWFVHKREDRVPLPLWHIIQTSGIVGLVDQGLVEPLVFLELAFLTRAHDVPKLLGCEVRDLLP
jgi:hypothetical protein